MGDIFLSDPEQTDVQKAYSNFLSDVRPDKIIPYLFSNQIFGHYEKQIIDAERTDWAKNDRLYEIVLSRATYPNVCAMREALLQSGDERHRMVASLLPLRESYGVPRTTSETDVTHGRYLYSSANFNRSYPAGLPWQESNEESVRRNRNLNNPHHVRGMQRLSINPGYAPDHNGMMLQQQDEFGRDFAPQNHLNRNNTYFQQNDIPYQHLNNYVGQRSMQPEDMPYRNPRFGATPPDPYSVGTGNHMYRGAPRENHFGNSGSPLPRDPAPRLDPLRDVGLDIYQPRPGNGRTGKGLCVIVSNFTADLRGYECDVRAITSFFRDELGYQILGAPSDKRFQNLTREKLIDELAKVQTYLAGELSTIDRFVLFVLSHGDEYGIKTCANRGGRDEEGGTVPNTRVRVTAQEIVDMFTHDKIPRMYGMPKCFFLQHCRGTETVRAAGRAGGVETTNKETPPPTAVGADTALFYATNLNCQSFVIDQKGSWFIEEAIKLMRIHHANEHLVDIMGGVNKALSIKCGTQQNSLSAYQMPSIVSSLTQKFYLTLPQHIPLPHQEL